MRYVTFYLRITGYQVKRKEETFILFSNFLVPFSDILSDIHREQNVL